jgi:RNA polymerase sigma-70 factor, ECF subfamily
MRSSKQDPEAERLLIERIRLGSSQAFEDLVRMHSQWIYDVSLKILKNHADAQDNTQNVLCRMYMSIDQFEGRSRFSSWLCRIAINEALMKIRRCHHEHIALDVLKTEGDERATSDLTDGKADPEREYMAKELMAKTFLCLHPSLAQLFIRRAEGWTHRELAAQIGITIPALKSRMFSARQRMQGRLQELC